MGNYNFENLYRLKNKRLTVEEFISQVQESLMNKRVRINKEDIEDMHVEIKECDPDKNLVHADLVFTLKGPIVNMGAGRVNVPYSSWREFRGWVKIHESETPIPITTPINAGFLYKENWNLEGTECALMFARSYLDYTKLLKNQLQMNNRDVLLLLTHEKLKSNSWFLKNIEIRKKSGLILIITHFGQNDKTFLIRYFIRVCFRRPCMAWSNTELCYLLPEVVYLDCQVPWEVWMFYYFNVKNFRDQILLELQINRIENLYYACCRKRKELIISNLKKRGGVQRSKMKDDYLFTVPIMTKNKRIYAENVFPPNDGKINMPYFRPFTEINKSGVFTENMTAEWSRIVKNLLDEISKSTGIPTDYFIPPSVCSDSTASKRPTASSIANEHYKKYVHKDTFGYFDVNKNCQKTECKEKEICPVNLNKLIRISIELNKSWYMLTPDDKLRGSRKNISYKIFLNDFTICAEHIKETDSRFSELRGLILLMHMNYKFIFEGHCDINTMHFPKDCGIQLRFISGMLKDQILGKPVRLILTEDVDINHAYILC